MLFFLIFILDSDEDAFDIERITITFEDLLVRQRLGFSQFNSWIIGARHDIHRILDVEQTVGTHCGHRWIGPTLETIRRWCKTCFLR